MEALKLPFYAKASLTFIGLISFVATLYFAQSIIVPLIYAIILATVLSPIVLFFERKKMNRVWAISISLLIVFLVLSLLAILLSSQMSMFTETLPKLLDKFTETLNRSVIWTSGRFDVQPKLINDAIAELKMNIIGYGKSSIGSTISSMGSALVVLFLIPVYVFMILFYESLLLDFIRKLFGKNNQTEVNDILTSTKTIIQKYLSALVLEAIIIATLNGIGLLIIGVDYAIVLAIMGAILNVVPYIGGILAVSFPIMVAIGTDSSSTTVLMIVGLYMVVQFVDNHYVVPKIVASKVRINALISIIVVLSGGALWGLAGMFLSIPLTAIMKVIFDHIEGLKPWGFLLGDTMPTQRNKFKRVL